MQPQTDAADFQAWKARRKAMWMAARPEQVRFVKSEFSRQRNS
jgi:hypothetical protein